MDLLLTLPFLATMLTVATIDLRQRIIPNRIVAFATLWYLAISLVFFSDSVSEGVLAGFAAGGFLLVVALVYPAGMGMGDVKLAGVMGLYLGTDVVSALIASFLLAAVVGFFIVLKSGLQGRKQAIPFAPFLAAGAIATLLWGQQLFGWYL